MNFSLIMFNHIISLSFSNFIFLCPCRLGEEAAECCLQGVAYVCSLQVNVVNLVTAVVVCICNCVLFAYKRHMKLG